MKKAMRVLLVSALIAWGHPFWVHAEDGVSQEEAVQTLDEIVVTATKTPRPRGNVTQKVDVIDSNEIERMVLRNGNLAETTSYLPGNYVNVLARNQPNWGSVGGLGTNYNTYMLDGLPMDTFCDPMSIDPWIIERVEVQRGPASVLYPNFLSQDFSGNQSPLAGTTNFILKERVEEPGTRLAGGYGRFDTVKGRVEHRNRVGNLHFFLGGKVEYSDYTNYRYKLTDAPSGLDMTKDPDYLNKSADFRTTYFFNNADDHKVSFYIHHMEHEGDMGRPHRELKHNYFSTQGKYQVPVSDWGSARLQMGYLYYDRNFGEDRYPASLESRGKSGVDQKILPADVSFAIKHFEGGLLTLGSDFQFADYKWFNGRSTSDRINDTEAQQFGVYLQEEYQMDRWVLRAGARYNYTRHDYDLTGGLRPEDTKQTWDSFLWSAGLRFKATEALSVYANAGTSHLVPAAKFIGGTIRASDEGKTGFAGMLPNPNLDAEKGFGSDLGIDCRVMENLNIGVRGFYNKIDDAVVTNTVHEEVNQTQAINAGKNTSYGLELSLRHEIKPFLNWFANYTYTHTNIENDVDPDLDNVEMSGYPEHMGNVGAMFRLPWEIRVSTWLRLVGSVYNSTSKSKRLKLDSYEILNLKIEKGFALSDVSYVNLFVELDNITDNRYKTLYYYQDPGFSTFAGLQLTF